MRFGLKPKCTCGSTDDRHKFSCDLWYGQSKKKRVKLIPEKKKRFGLFYPMVVKKK